MDVANHLMKGGTAQELFGKMSERFPMVYLVIATYAIDSPCLKDGQSVRRGVVHLTAVAHLYKAKPNHIQPVRLRIVVGRQSTKHGQLPVKSNDPVRHLGGKRSDPKMVQG